MKMDGSLGFPMSQSFDGYVTATKPNTTESTFGTTCVQQLSTNSNRNLQKLNILVSAVQVKFRVHVETAMLMTRPISPQRDRV